MKPNPSNAMQRLILEIRQTLPFNLDESQLCRGPCQGCSKKLLEYLDTELCDWEMRLERGHHPRLGDLARLAKTARRIRTILSNNAIINPD